ncbi:MAG TPA: (d)CMP kinase [Bacteroidales bacterium]|jgi:cytidylate kinase|nr:(d)CMP kinase [Bacteroidales bacterium]
MKSHKPLVIAVDGYSSCGKSTYAKLIARELGYTYIDSGAMYRAVALYALRKGLASDKQIEKLKLIQSLDQIEIRFRNNEATGAQETWLNDENVEKEIRGIEVSNIVSKISQIEEVREKMVRLQRTIGSGGCVVMDGRDIGSTVFPEAAFKIFMTADAKIRAQRRYKELSEKGISVDFEEILRNIRMRDHEDETREVSPLRKAPDALVLDNSQMTIGEQMVWFAEKWERVAGQHESRN